ncbi:MAG: SLC13 family permease [Candidatus Hydrogenedentes bacterium]|nr:SLC13 family permease [Candidatus Hydrogenedentota bacterium]
MGLSGDQWFTLGVLAAALGLFVWGRWRYDLVAIAALLAVVMWGLVPPEEAFAGFGHPAVVTVACVLVLGQGLQSSGAVDVLARRLLPSSAGPSASILALSALAALLSGFMNNVGALALLMPVAIQLAGKHDLPPGRVLMPLAFASILGGTTTLIGTPPNLIVSGFRQAEGAGGFGMFSFAMVGAPLALAGVAFIGLAGWRLVPGRKQPAGGSFETGSYLSEVRVKEGSKAAGKRIREIDQLLDESDAQIVGLVRHEVRLSAPNPGRIVRAGDILVIEIDPESISSALSGLGLGLEEDRKSKKREQEGEEAGPDAGPDSGEDGGEEAREAESGAPGDIVIQELVVAPGALIASRSATDIELRTRYGINLLAISRQGRRSIKRLRSTRLKPGDVLLLQGAEEALAGFASQFGCLPLAARGIRVPRKGEALAAALVMACAVAAVVAGWFPASVAFAAGALAMVLAGVVPVRSIYTSVDWPVVVLLGAMLPVAGAMASTGAADVIARLVLDSLAGGNAIVALALLLIATMLLTDLMNNAATTAVMCPIALSSASQLGVNGDTFLMAVAVGASCAFLTPIGHQNNTLILGPGGFRFGDYWRLGLPLDVIVVGLALPLLLWAWPLG